MDTDTEKVIPAAVLSEALLKAGVKLAVYATGTRSAAIETALAETAFAEVDELVRLFEGTMPKGTPQIGATIRVDAFGWGDVVTLFDVKLTRRRLTPTGALQLVWVNGPSMPQAGGPL